ncbi:LPP20 family lipoprotein [Desulfovibrio mangrovi]|uniref:LPP20 family lipoprotein n=1 Tax=Desulfovibrio mangrovi TaxID=2976983 RepID=UPI00224657B5|nr:LPP20 family lipoprotein [Desulfovibrio mangrovi]UZP68717.1 LPP20 family lipoprotein [Desulfovibrio mangrovi]
MRYLTPIISLLCTLCLFSPALGNPMQEAMGSSGYIDWQNMRAIGSGMGVVPANASQAQARFLGTRAAAVDARRNLLEVVKGVRIDSTTVVNNYLVQNDVIASQVQGFVQGAQVENTWITNDGIYHATVSLPLTGAFGKMLMVTLGTPPPRDGMGEQDLPPATRQRIGELERRIDILMSQMEALRAALDKQETRISGVESAISGQGTTLSEMRKQLDSPARPQQSPPLPSYSGLVVDARGSGFTPCLRPELHGPDGLIFPSQTLNRQVAAAEGFVRYMDSIPAAQRLQRVGNLPLTIKATGTVSGTPSALTVSENDAATLHSLLTGENNMLDTCRIVIVF